MAHKACLPAGRAKRKKKAKKMDNENRTERSNYDVASIGRGENSKRANYVLPAMFIEKDRVAVAGSFIKVFADIFLKKEVTGSKAYF